MKKMNNEVFESVCLEIEETEKGLRTICKSLNSSASSFYDFIDNEKDEDVRRTKAERYTRARKRQAEYLFDLQREVVFKRDEDHTPFTGSNVIQRDRLISETIKWQASKLDSKKYGEKIDLTTDGDKLPNAIPIVLGNGKSYDDLINELKPE